MFSESLVLLVSCLFGAHLILTTVSADTAGDIVLINKKITVTKPSGYVHFDVAGWFYITPGSKLTVQVDDGERFIDAVSPNATPLPVSIARDRNDSFYDAKSHNINGAFTMEHTFWFLMVFDGQHAYLARDEFVPDVPTYVYVNLSSLANAASLCFTSQGEVWIHELTIMSESPGWKAFSDNFPHTNACVVPSFGLHRVFPGPVDSLRLPSRCDPRDECALDPCNGYPCSNFPGHFTCHCGVGWTSDRCDLACPEGTYGANCALNCTCNTNNTATCNATNGQCVCNTGWHGSECTDDVDECNEMPAPQHLCPHLALCSNTNGSFVCLCLDGFAIENDTCVDIDECHEKTDGCDQRCVNDEGSFYCACDPGYLLHSGNRCQDIDECHENKAGCDQRCVNEQGSFHCDCDLGYFLHSDNRTCKDLDECKESNGGCEQKCSNGQGSFQCECNEGYLLSSDNKSCQVACNAGEGWNGSSCVPCAVGWWNSGNDTQRFEPCTPCPENYSTAAEGATDPYNCSVWACNPGEQFNSSSCVPCTVGWWNSGNNTQRFEPCTPCHEGYVTDTEGAIDPHNCSVRDCSPGKFIDGLRGDLCSPCSVNTYQNKARQDHCRPCPPGTHTKTAGSSSLSDCIAPPGEKNTASLNLKYALVVVCTSREANSVRQTLRARVLGLRSEWPDMCPDSSCSNAQVSASCAGPNSKSVIAVVKLEELPATLTSLSTGTTMTTENMLLTSAVKDEAFELPESVGATLQRDDIRIALEKTCAVGFQRFGDTCDCGEGTFKKIANDSIQCDVCPAGSYQDRPGKYSCNPCPAGTSTTTTGADEQSDCTPTGKAVADTSTSGSGVSAALIGSIVGGLLGLLAVLLVVFTVYRVFKKGGPMQTFLTARRFHEEHGYYGLFTAQATHGYGDKEGIEMRQHMGVPASLIIPELPPRFNNGEEVYDYIADDDTARYVISPLRQAIASAPDDVEDECYLHPVFGETTSAEIDSQDGPSSFKPKLHQFRQHEAKSTRKDDDDSGSDEDLDTPPADYEDNVFDVAEVVAKSTREDGHDNESDEDLDAPPADYEDNVFDMAEKWTEEKKDPEAVTYIH